MYIYIHFVLFIAPQEVLHFSLHIAVKSGQRPQRHFAQPLEYNTESPLLKDSISDCNTVPVFGDKYNPHKSWFESLYGVTAESAGRACCCFPLFEQPPLHQPASQTVVTKSKHASVCV